MMTFVVICLLIVLIIAQRWLVWTIRKRRADWLAELAKIGPDGKPYPPHGRGICDVCKNACEKVYFKPDGKRICQPCYDASCRHEPGPAKPGDKK